MLTMPEIPLPRTTPEPVVDLTEPTPLQALATAYADRLAAIGAGAGDAELAGSELRIHELEQVCRITYRSTSRTAVPDSALFLG
jgi:hypothetical protein